MTGQLSLNGIDPIAGATVGQLRELLEQYPEDMPVVMRTYHKADICPIAEVAQIHYDLSDITRVELRMRKFK